VASNSCRAGKAQTSTSESGGDFSLASTLQSKIKNQKSKIARLPRQSREGISPSPRLFNQKSKIKNRQTSTSKSGGDFSLASTLQSKIKNQKSKID
jgi:hypothetical protein